MSVVPTDPSHSMPMATDSIERIGDAKIIRLDVERLARRGKARKKPVAYDVVLSGQVLKSATAAPSFVTRHSHAELVQRISHALSSACEVDKGYDREGMFYTAAARETGRRYRSSIIEGCTVYFNICDEREVVEIELISSLPDEPSTPPSSFSSESVGGRHLQGDQRLVVREGHVRGIVIRLMLASLVLSLSAAIAFVAGVMSADNGLAIRGTVVADISGPEPRPVDFAAVHPSYIGGQTALVGTSLWAAAIGAEVDRGAFAVLDEAEFEIADGSSSAPAAFDNIAPTQAAAGHLISNATDVPCLFVVLQGRASAGALCMPQISPEGMTGDTALFQRPAVELVRDAPCAIAIYHEGEAECSR